MGEHFNQLLLQPDGSYQPTAAGSELQVSELIDMVVPTPEEMDERLNEFLDSLRITAEGDKGKEDSGDDRGVPHKPPVPGETSIKYKST